MLGPPSSPWERVGVRGWMHTLKAVSLIEPHPGFQVAVFVNRLFGASGGWIGGTRFGTVACLAGDPLDTIL